jgi:TolA-binding protein
LRERGQTDACVKLARTLPPLFPLDQSLYEEGLAFREAGNRMEAALGQRFDVRDQDQQSKLRALFAQAGAAFESSARLRYESIDYTKTLWDAIFALQKSGQFARSIPLLDDYVSYEDRIQHPRALIALGQAYLAVGKPQDAIRPLTECMEEFPRDPLCYDARLQVAKAMAELDQIDEARRLLEINLTDGELTPQSLTWKESLLSLGEILWRRCNETHIQESLGARDRREAISLETLRANQPLVEESISRLNEAVVRYWPDPRALQAATYLASANRLAAVLPDEEARIPDALDATRRRLLKKRESFLNAAIDTYRKVRTEISRIEDERELGPSEQSMRQIGLLGEADTLYELGQFEESADAYRTISLRYMNEPPALEAMLGQARCLRSMKRDRDARLVIRQAVAVLGRIPAEWDSRFAETTRYDRKGWESLLSWMDREPLPPATDS